jgi:hypothetical protein
LVTKAQDLIKGQPHNAADDTFVSHLIDAVTAIKAKVSKDVRSQSPRLQILRISRHIVEFRLLRLLAQISPRSLRNASKWPTTKTAPAKRRERRQKRSGRRLACEFCYDFMSQIQQFYCKSLTLPSCLKHSWTLPQATKMLRKNGTAKGFTRLKKFADSPVFKMIQNDSFPFNSPLNSKKHSRKG